MTVSVKGRQLVGSERQHLVLDLMRRYPKESLRDLAAATGRSKTWIRAVLIESGVQMQSRGGYRGPRLKIKSASTGGE